MRARTATRKATAGQAEAVDATAFLEAVSRSFAKGGAGALLLIDLDSFFQVNAQAGRAAGDKVIAVALAVLKRTAEEEGWRLGRVGGDEFALYAPEATVEQALLRGERLRTLLGAALLKYGPKGLRVTASIGVAAAPRDAKTAQELMKKADLALYAAKEQGGDAVALAPSDEMVLKSSYYTQAQLGRLKALAERLKKKESVLLRDALDDLLRRHDRS